MRSGPKHSEHQIDLYWDMYKQNQEWRRHHERLRANATNIILAIAAAITAIIFSNRQIDAWDSPLSLLIILAGAIGIQLCDKHYERAAYHAATARAAIGYMYQGAPEYSLSNFIKEKRKEHTRESVKWERQRVIAERFRRFRKWCLNFKYSNNIFRILNRSRHGLIGGRQQAWRLWRNINALIIVVGVGLLLISIAGWFLGSPNSAFGVRSGSQNVIVVLGDSEFSYVIHYDPNDKAIKLNIIE